MNRKEVKKEERSESIVMNKNKIEEVKNMNKKIDMIKIRKKYESLSDKEKESIGYEADEWIVMIENSEKHRKKYLQKIKTDEHFAMIKMIIDNGTTQPQQQQKKARDTQTYKVTIKEAVKNKQITAKGRKAKEAEAFRKKMAELENMTIVEKRTKGLLDEQITMEKPIEMNIKQNKGEAKLRKEQQKMAQKEVDRIAKQMLEERKKKEQELKSKEAERKRSAITMQNFQRLKQLAGIKAQVQKDKFGHPIVFVNYNKKRAMFNGFNIMISGSDTSFMYENVWQYSIKRPIRIPVKITDIQRETIFAEPCKEEIERISKRLKQQNAKRLEIIAKRRQEDLVKKAVDSDVIIFDNKVWALVNLNKKKILDERFKELVLNNPSEMQGVWKLVPLPPRRGSPEKYVFLKPIENKPIKTFTNYDVEKKRIEQFGVHDKNFVCKTRIDGKRTIFVMLPDTPEIKETACHEVDTSRICINKEGLEKITEKGSDKVWRMQYEYLYNDKNKITNKIHFKVTPLEYIGTSEEYINKLYGDE